MTFARIIICGAVICVALVGCGKGSITEPSHGEIPPEEIVRAYDIFRTVGTEDSYYSANPYENDGAGHLAAYRKAESYFAWQDSRFDVNNPLLMDFETELAPTVIGYLTQSDAVSTQGYTHFVCHMELAQMLGYGKFEDDPVDLGGTDYLPLIPAPLSPPQYEPIGPTPVMPLGVSEPAIAVSNEFVCIVAQFIYDDFDSGLRKEQIIYWLNNNYGNGPWVNGWITDPEAATPVGPCYREPDICRKEYSSVLPTDIFYTVYAADSGTGLISDPFNGIYGRTFYPGGLTLGTEALLTPAIPPPGGDGLFLRYMRPACDIDDSHFYVGWYEQGEEHEGPIYGVIPTRVRAIVARLNYLPATGPGDFMSVSAYWSNIFLIGGSFGLTLDENYPNDKLGLHVDGKGNVIFVYDTTWGTQLNSIRTLAARTYFDGGWTDPIIVSDTFGNGLVPLGEPNEDAYPGFYDVEFDDLNGIHIVWSDGRPGASLECKLVNYRFFDGGYWQPTIQLGAEDPSLLEDENGTARIEPAVAVDGNNMVNVIYTKILFETPLRPLYLYKRIHGTYAGGHNTEEDYQFYDVNWNDREHVSDYLYYYETWQDPTQQVQRQIHKIASFHPDVTTDKFGNDTVVFATNALYIDPVEFYDNNIYLRRQMGTTWSDIIDVNVDLDYEYEDINPAIDCDASGRCHVVWQTRDYYPETNWRIMWRPGFFDYPHNNSFNDAYPFDQLIVTDGEYDYFTPDVAVGDTLESVTPNVHIVYVESNNDAQFLRNIGFTILQGRYDCDVGTGPDGDIGYNYHPEDMLSCNITPPPGFPMVRNPRITILRVPYVDPASGTVKSLEDRVVIVVVYQADDTFNGRYNSIVCWDYMDVTPGTIGSPISFVSPPDNILASSMEYKYLNPDVATNGADFCEVVYLWGNLDPPTIGGTGVLSKTISFQYDGTTLSYSITPVPYIITQPEPVPLYKGGYWFPTVAVDGQGNCHFLYSKNTDVGREYFYNKRYFNNVPLLSAYEDYCLSESYLDALLPPGLTHPPFRPGMSISDNEIIGVWCFEPGLQLIYPFILDYGYQLSGCSASRLDGIHSINGTYF